MRVCSNGIYVCQDSKNANAYQRFVKTTPKPKATKKSSGELEPLLLLLLFELFVLEGMAVCGLVTSDDVAVADCVVVVAALTTIWATSPRTWSMTAMAGYLQNEQRWQAAAMDSRPWFVVVLFFLVFLHVPSHRQHGSCDGGRALYFQSVAKARSRRSAEGVHHARLKLERSFFAGVVCPFA